MPRLPRAILFDLDDTIIRAYGRSDRAWAAVIGEFAPMLAPLNDGQVLGAILQSARTFWEDSARARIWRQKIREARREVVACAFAALAEKGKYVPAADVQCRLADRFSDYRNENLELFPDAHTTVDALRMRGVKLALVTNGASTDQREKIERFQLTERFDHIQIEGEHGFGKPEPRAYQHALQSLGVNAPESWIIGDNLEWEVSAPQQLGIHAIWFDPDGVGLPQGTTARPDRIVRMLPELLEPA